MANFEVICQVISSSINLLFLKSDIGIDNESICWSDLWFNKSMKNYTELKKDIEL